ncbi:class I SAM-dependent methyltransferase [Limibacter armeniacum]|uniref:O-methyltransferase n=1 Tax=Limibacter armeniacum TaxID=466084 RepID=UPI002FE55AFC
MPSDIYIGTLLKSLIASKPKANILELGTGVSLSLAWMIEGLDEHSNLTSIDNDPKLIGIAKDFFGNDPRLNLICIDGTEWIKNYSGDKFDLIFADAWPGKYSELEETLELLKVGGFYVIDDMTPQPNWPEGHNEKAENLTAYLESREDLTMTKMNWSTGVIICTKKA